MNLEESVYEFHKMFKCPINGKFENQNLVDTRLKLIDEEYNEVLCAVKNGDKENLLKELADLVYVCIGTSISFGWDFNEAFRRVHVSNMSKRGENGKPIFREDGKVLKGPDYKKADLSDLVK